MPSRDVNFNFLMRKINGMVWRLLRLQVTKNEKRKTKNEKRKTEFYGSSGFLTVTLQFTPFFKLA